MFELHRAGRRYRRALPTLVREAAIGRATAVVIDRFLERDNVSVEHADSWLAGVQDDAQGGGGPDLGALGPEALFDALTSGGHLALQLDQPEVARAVRRRAAIMLGVDEAWFARWSDANAPAQSATEQATELAFEIDLIRDMAASTEDARDSRLSAVSSYSIVKRRALAASAGCESVTATANAAVAV